MREYELRFLKRDRTLSMSMLTIQMSAPMAIQQAYKMAQGLPFEVWCGDNRLHGIPDEKLTPHPRAHQESE